MSDKSYSTEVFISVQPESVFNAITLDIDKWWTELSNQAASVGKKLIVRFEKSTIWEMIVSEAIPDRSLVWIVKEANHDFDGITKKDEWKNTKIEWKIEKIETGSRVVLSHNGLLPALQCYKICEAGWDFFMQSLKNYLETGVGTPYKQETPG